MSLLDIILKYKPKTWVSADYEDVPYRLFPVHHWEKEYNEVETVLVGNGIVESADKSIERIQHAYAYCQYAVRKAHLYKFLSDHISEERLLLLLNGSELQAKNLITYNGDLRRGASITKTHPKYILVMRVIHHSSLAKDSDRFPEYFVKM